MSAYLIYDVEIHDPVPYAAFMEQVKPLVQQMGGAYLARGGAHEVLEGDWSPSRIVLFEFPDMDSARALFTSEAYAPLKALRQSCSTGHVVIVDGL